MVKNYSGLSSCFKPGLFLVVFLWFGFYSFGQTISNVEFNNNKTQYCSGDQIEFSFTLTNDNGWRKFNLNTEFYVKLFTPNGEVSNFIFKSNQTPTGNRENNTIFDAPKILLDQSWPESDQYRISISSQNPNVGEVQSIPFTINRRISNSVINNKQWNCKGGYLSLNLDMDYTVNNVSYSWSGPDGFTSNLASPQIEAIEANSGVYTVELSSECSPGPISISKEILFVDEDTKDVWRGEVFDNVNFTNSLGFYYENEEFNQEFGLSDFSWDVCNSGSVYPNTFSVQYKMHSNKKGLYVVDLGSDDGSRLSVDGILVYNNWTDQAWSSRPQVLMNLTGNSQLVYDFYENTGENRITFKNLTRILENKLTGNTNQTICAGETSASISGDIFGTLPPGLNGTGYQWTYSTSFEGTRNNIADATLANFTPDVNSAPFNNPGTYYIFRNASLSSSNNIDPNPYVATNESNAAVINVVSNPEIVNQPVNQNICAGELADFFVDFSESGLLYQWWTNTGSGWYSISDGENYSGTTSPSLTILNTATWMNNHQFRVVATGSNSCQTTSSVANLMVNASPAIWNHPVNSTICYNENTSFDVNSSGTDFQWQVSTNVGVSWIDLTNSLAYSNVTTRTLQINSAQDSLNSNLYRARILIGNCSIYSNPASLTVNTLPLIEVEPVNTTVCIGSDAHFQSTVTGTNLSYQWQAFGGSWYNINDNANYNGTKTSQLTMPNVQSWQNDYTFRLIITNSAGCSTISEEVLLTVSSQITLAITYEQSPYCSNLSNPQNVSLTGPSGGTFSASPEGLSINASTGAILPSSSISGTYTVTYNNNNNACTNTIASTNVIVDASFKWTGVTNTDWNTASNWVCNSLPTLETDVLIPGNLSSDNYPVINAGAIALTKNLNIENGASVIVNQNWLQIAGDLTNTGILNTETGNVSFEGSTAQTIPADAFENNRIQNLRIDNTSGVTSEAIIEVTGILKVENGNFNTGNKLILISDATQTALIDGSGNGQILDIVTMQRYLDVAFGYKYFSSPFSNSNVGDFGSYVDLTPASFPNFYRYNENRQDANNNAVTGWEIYTSPTATLGVLTGYAVNFGSLTSSKTVEISGTVNNGDYEIALTNNNRTYTNGFNLVGNPYPSPIDWNAVPALNRTNIDDAIYFFTAGSTNQYTGTYTSYVDGISADGRSSSIIPSMQGFFVHVSDGGDKTSVTNGILALTNAVRENDFTQQFLKVSEPEKAPLIRISAGFENEVNTDPAVLYFPHFAKLSFEKEKDALKLMNTDVLVPNLYSLTPENKKLSINALPKPASNKVKKIPLGLKTEKDGWMSIGLQDLQNLPSNFNVYLIDSEKRIGQNLSIKPQYRFYAKSGQLDSRFHLMFSETELSDPAMAFDEPFSVRTVNGKVMVSMNLEPGQSGVLQASTVTGQILDRKNVSEKQILEIEGIKSSGVYFFSINLKDGMFSKKVLIQK